MMDENSVEVIRMPCRDLFAKGRKPVTVLGPVLEEEAKKIHEGFWD